MADIRVTITFSDAVHLDRSRQIEPGTLSALVKPLGFVTVSEEFARNKYLNASIPEEKFGELKEALGEGYALSKDAKISFPSPDDPATARFFRKTLG